MKYGICLLLRLISFVANALKSAEHFGEILARLLRLGELKAVYKGDDRQQQLREFFRAYDNLVEDATLKRMAKKQQMQWSRRGAHLLLQVRTGVLNEDLEKCFRAWYPGFRPRPQKATA